MEEIKKIALGLFASTLFTPFASAAGADLIGAAATISLPYSETVSNAGYSSLPADEYCDSSEGDFFYKYTPSVNETINVVALGADTEVAVYNLAATGSECLVIEQDADNVINPVWFTNAYRQTFADCSSACSESRNVALTAGTEYIIMVASNSEDSVGVIEVRMGSGTDSASLESNVVPTSPVWLLGIGADLIGAAATISLPYSETVSNAGYSSLPADEYCDSSEGDFFYKYTPSVNETINVVALGADTEVAVYNLAATGSECLVIQQDADNVINPVWFTNAYPQTFDEDDCATGCSESRNVALTAGTEYIIMVASNSEDSVGVIEVRMGSGTDSASLESNIVATTVPTSVPTSPVWLLGIMAGLLSLVGVRKLRKV